VKEKSLMARHRLVNLFIAAIIGSALLSACSSGGEPKQAATTVGTEEAGAERPDLTPLPTLLEAFPGVPLPEGARELGTGTISAAQAPVPVGSDINTRELSDVTIKVLEVNTSPADVIQFYEDHRDGWEKEASEAVENGMFLIWSRDGGQRVIWIFANSGTTAGTTELGIWEAHVQN